MGDPVFNDPPELRIAHISTTIIRNHKPLSDFNLSHFLSNITEFLGVVYSTEIVIKLERNKTSMHGILIKFQSIYVLWCSSIFCCIAIILIYYTLFASGLGRKDVSKYLDIEIKCHVPAYDRK